MAAGCEEDSYNSFEKKTVKKDDVKEEDKRDIEEDSEEEVELIWDGVPGIQFTKEEEEDVSQLCEDILC